MSDRILKVPHVVKGRLVEGADIEHLSRDTGSRFATPQLDLSNLVWSRTEPGPAFDVPLTEIMDLLVETGLRLDAGNQYLKEALEALAPVSTLSAPTLRNCFESLPRFFNREALEFQADQGGLGSVDSWRQVSGPDRSTHWVRGFPPRLVHILPGNTPMTAATTIITGALTKGVHLLKMASNELFSATAVLRTMADIDPDHPVVHSFSAVYWRGGDEQVESVIYRPQFFDKLVAWGGEASIRHALKYIGPGFELVTYDPKSSVSVIGKEAFASDQVLREVADRAAADATVFEQDACVASRFHFVESSVDDADRYGQMLAEALPKERPFASAGGTHPTPSDIREVVDVLRDLEPEYRVWGDYSGAGLVVRSDEPVDFFPDARTVNIVPVGSLLDVARFATVATQTVSMFPIERAVQIRDALASAGVQQISNLGQAGHGLPGLPHDGMLPMPRLLRWVVQSD
ncbi:MAG TPA: acyl-CoA reductase [Acidimicrobiales bacterium]|nr:acyl-CoA reductase [Acidimicrobiales bacterium]